MSLNTNTLLTTTTFGIPSGNYNGTTPDFVSNVVAAANYYGGQGSIQTITIQLTDFVGKITLRATLNDLAESAPWFDLDVYDNTAGPGETTTVSYAPIGNFTWLRADITEFTGGTINSITVAF